MSHVLSGNASLLAGLLLLALVIGVRSATRDAQLKDDLRGALQFALLFLFAKALTALFDTGAPPPALLKAGRVVWMVAFAFAVVRAVVSLTLWAYRRVSGRPTSKILRDAVDVLLYLATAVPILKSQLDIDLTSLLATSAIVSVVIGLALQDTLGNLFAGLSLQLERPFEPGDFITVGHHTGRVVQTGWRSTRVETFRHELVTLTNNSIAREAVTNYTRGGRPVGVDVFFGVSYGAAPNEVRGETLAALSEISLVLKEPAPSCFVAGYEDSSVKWMIRCFIADYADLPHLQDEIYTRLWYRFARAGIEIPFPQRVMHLRPSEPARPRDWGALLARVDLFKPLGPADVGTVATSARERRFGRKEVVVREGDEGHTFYIVAQGGASVRAAAAGGEVAKLGPGDYFGEMSLLTGAPRAATVVALDDLLLLELDRPVFAGLLAAHPDLATQLSEVLGRRQEQLAAAGSAARTEVGDPAAHRILVRLRQIFGLRG